MTAAGKIPELLDTGDWVLHAYVKSDPMEPVDLDVGCPVGTFRDDDGLCDDCLRGGGCAAAGTTLETLDLGVGYWREGPRSRRVRTCEVEAACRAVSSDRSVFLRDFA